MKRWIYGWELLERWDCTPIELLNHIKSGLPIYDGLLGRRIVDVDSLPRKKIENFEEVIDASDRRRAERGRFFSNKLNAVLKGKESATDDIDEQGISEFLYFDMASNTIPIIPPDCKVMSLRIPSDDDEALEFLEKLKNFRSKYADVVQYELKNKVLYSSSPFKKLTQVQQDKLKALEIAGQYLKNCENNGSIPSIKDAVEMVKREHMGQLYKDPTIHNWIKKQFPPASRKPGRRSKKL